MNELKTFAIGGDEASWRSPSFRQSVIAKIDEVIQKSGMPTARNSSEMENHVFGKAKSREEYLSMVARLILHVREINSKKSNMQPGAQNQQGNGPQQVGQQNQGQQGGGGNMATDPINALQNLTQGSRNNQMMNMGSQGQMQQPPGGGPSPMGGMQNQMGPQGPIGPQGGPQNPPIPATNLLQTLNQRPQLGNLQLQNRLNSGMAMMTNQQMGVNNMGQMGPGQMQGQPNGPNMHGQMMPNMSVQNSMQGNMVGINTMASQMQGNQLGGMGGQMDPSGMQGQMMGGMGGNQMVPMNIMHQMPRGKVEGMQQLMSGSCTSGGGYSGGPRSQGPGPFFGQSPSPSAPSPAGMGGPSPASMGMMSVPMASPMGVQGSPALVPSPGHHVHPQHMQRGVGGGSPSSINTPGTCVASPQEEAVYREKVRQLSKYIEPLRRMINRMVTDGENVSQLIKMKNLLNILSNPSRRMPLETLLKCEVALEKLDFKRSEGAPLQIPGYKENQNQMFNPLLDAVYTCLQSPHANHTLKRTFGPCVEALNGPEIRSSVSSAKMSKVEEDESKIPDVLQGEIARLDSRFKVSLDSMQLSGKSGSICLVAQLDDFRLPCVPPVLVSVPRDYPASSPTARMAKLPAREEDTFLSRVEKALESRVSRLPRACSVAQILLAWEMSVRQACAPTQPQTVATSQALAT